MNEPYTGNDRRYAGEEVEISYSLKRCIHAEHCVKRLSSVFDKERRPWINANAAEAAQVATVIELCPSGALHYHRKDGIQESVPDRNTITVRADGPLQIRGDLTIHGATVALERETRVTLCRCGASKNKPFCDNSHKDIDFQAVEIEAVGDNPEHASGGKLIITALSNGPLELLGEITILNEAGEVLSAGRDARLCRCGGSSRKPFCDGTHLRSEFAAE